MSNRRTLPPPDKVEEHIFCVAQARGSPNADQQAVINIRHLKTGS